MFDNLYDIFFDYIGLGINLIVGICIYSLIISVFIDFKLYNNKKNITKNKLKSQVATGRMFIFFFVVYFILKLNIGTYFIIQNNIHLILIGIGLFITIFSTFFNILGRFYLKNNWANNIKIYEDHYLVNSGPYKLVRHPLYASLIWINYGVGLIYSNWLVFLLGTFVFLPMMYYRAKQEEKLLTNNFQEYNKYKQKVGMFFPKIF